MAYSYSPHNSLSAINLESIDDVTSILDNISYKLLNYRDAVDYARNNVREYGKAYAKDINIFRFYLNFPVEKLAFNSFVDLYNLIDLIKSKGYRRFYERGMQGIIRKNR